MNRLRLYLLALAALFVCSVKADEGMWLLQLMQQQHSIDMMKKQGLKLEAQDLYNPNGISLKDAVGIFGGGCTGEIISPEGLILTNHHCGYASIQQHSSVEHDYLTDGFWATSRDKELPTPGLQFTFIERIEDITDIVNAKIAAKEITESESFSNIFLQKLAHDLYFKSDLADKKGIVPQALPFYAGNKFYLFYKKIYPDVRMVAAPPSSIGKFGGETDNWMWPRHTGDFSMFRIYADANGEPAEYSASNTPLKTKKHLSISIKGLKEGDYAMIMGFPGRTSRYLTVSEVKERMESTNEPRIRIRGARLAVLKEVMNASDKIRIQYANKYAGSSNYWKNSIGMNKGLANLKVIDRKREEEAAFAAWVAQDAKRKEVYGDVLSLLEKGYTSSSEYKKISTYLGEAFLSGAEIVKLARMIQSVDVKGSTPEEIDIFLEDNIKSFFKDYDASLDRKVLAAMMKIVKERVPAENLPDIYKKVDKKYKGDYEKYAADVFKKTSILSYDNIASMLKDPKKYAKLKKDPAAELSLSVLISLFELQQLTGDSYYDIAKGERLYFAGLKEMHPEKAFASDANFTMRVSYGSIGGYRPYDAAWYDYYTTQKGIFEKENPESDEFWVQPEILNLIRSKDFGQYANKDGELQLCFLSNNDITGGNSGSPVFDKNARLIGLAFDGNWEAMSGDIAFEPDLQRTISVDIRYVLYMIDKWGKCPRLIEELKLVK